MKRIYQEAPSATVVGIDNMNDYYDVALKEFRLNELAKYPTFTFSLLCDEHMRIRKNGGLFQPLCWSNPPFFCRAATQRWKQTKNKIR